MFKGFTYDIVLAVVAFDGGVNGVKPPHTHTHPMAALSLGDIAERRCVGCSDVAGPRGEAYESKRARRRSAAFI